MPPIDAPQPEAAAKTSPFRTYASDVARLTGKPLPKKVVNETVPKAPAPPAPEPPPAPVIPKAPSTNETGDAVLKRLKPEPDAVPVKVPEPPPEAPVRPHTPTFYPTKPPVSLHTIATPPPGIPIVSKPRVEAPAPIHTYKTDLAHHTETTGISRIAMVAAEQDAAGHGSPIRIPPKRKNAALLIVASVILIIAGVGSVYAAYRFAAGNPPIPEEAFIPSLVFADERVELKGSGEELRQALAATTGTSLEERDIAIVYMTYSTTTEAGVVERIASGNDVFSALRLPAPDILLRNIDAPTTLGVMQVGEETRPFFILRVSSFDRTYAGMLSWEATIERDLALFYPPYEAAPSLGTSTASSTPSTGTKTGERFRLSFIDEVIDNRDVRVLKDASNRVIMLYGYRDKETLIIARNGEMFSELLARLSSTRSR